MRNGCTATTTLLAKDTSHRTVFPVFTAGGGFGMPEMEGGAEFLLIADPTTFRVLPWAEKTGWVLCDIYFRSGQPVPFSTRALYRAQLARCFERVLREGIMRGAFPPLDPAVAAACIVGAFMEALVGPLAPTKGTGPRPDRVLVDQITQFCLRASLGEDAG